MEHRPHYKKWLKSVHPILFFAPVLFVGHPVLNLSDCMTPTSEPHCWLPVTHHISSATAWAVRIWLTQLASVAGGGNTTTKKSLQQQKVYVKNSQIPSLIEYVHKK